MARILLIEDQPHQRQLYQEELTDEGFEVDVASDGEEGLELFTRQQPNVVVVDILLPGMNGIELMEKMLSINPHLPIIVHSAYSSPSRDFITWFARAYVVKSGDLRELKGAISDVLRQTTPSDGTREASARTGGVPA